MLTSRSDGWKQRMEMTAKTWRLKQWKLATVVGWGRSDSRRDNGRHGSKWPWYRVDISINNACYLFSEGNNREKSSQRWQEYNNVKPLWSERFFSLIMTALHCHHHLQSMWQSSDNSSCSMSEEKYQTIWYVVKSLPYHIVKCAWVALYWVS